VCSVCVFLLSLLNKNNLLQTKKNNSFMLMCIHERKRGILYFLFPSLLTVDMLLSLSFFFLVSCSCSFFPLIRRGKGNCLSPFESAGEQLVNRRKKLMFFSHCKMEYNVSRNFFFTTLNIFYNEHLVD
jgi:hypothetical protein